MFTVVFLISYVFWHMTCINGPMVPMFRKKKCYLQFPSKIRQPLIQQSEEMNLHCVHSSVNLQVSPHVLLFLYSKMHRSARQTRLNKMHVINFERISRNSSDVAAKHVIFLEYFSCTQSLSFPQCSILVSLT